MATAKLYTVEDLDSLPDSELCELWRGALRPMTPTAAAHTSVTHRLVAALGSYVYPRDLGELGGETMGVVFERGPDTVLCPDVAFVARARLPEGVGPGFLELAPDLAVEVLSPSDRAGATRRRVDYFLRHGVRLVWVIDPRRRTVRVLTPDGTETVLTEDDELSGAEVIPGFHCPVATLFAGLRR